MEDKKIELASNNEEKLENNKETVLSEEHTNKKDELKEEDSFKKNEESTLDELPEDLDLSQDDLLNDDFGDEFKVEESKSKIYLEDGSFTEDFSSYAKGFPDWDLLPPKD